MANSDEPLDLSVIIAPTITQIDPESCSQDESKAFDTARDEKAIDVGAAFKKMYDDRIKTLKLREKLEPLKSSKQDRKERKLYADKIFKLICVWLLSVLYIVVAQAIWAKTGEFSLPVPVLLTITGGTTVSVLGIFIVVIQYLFPNKGVGINFTSKKSKKTKGRLEEN